MDMLTARCAAIYLGVPLRTFYALGLPCYRYRPRCTRWALQDLEAYKEKCRSTSTAPKSAGVSVSTASSPDDVAELRNSLQRAGAATRPRPTTARKADVYTLKRPASPSRA